MAQYECMYIRLTFLNNNELWVTEKAEYPPLHVVDGCKNRSTRITSPMFTLEVKGGPLDSAIAPNYDETGIIYFTYQLTLGEEKGGHTALYSTQLRRKSISQY